MPKKPTAKLSVPPWVKHVEEVCTWWLNHYEISDEQFAAAMDPNTQIVSEDEGIQGMLRALQALELMKRCLAEGDAPGATQAAFDAGVEYMGAGLGSALDHKSAIIEGRDNALKAGRLKGNEQKKRNAEKNHARIQKVIDDLYRSGRGYQMNQLEIARYLRDPKNPISKYSENQTLKLVKKFAPAAKRKHKTAASPG